MSPGDLHQVPYLVNNPVDRRGGNADMDVLLPVLHIDDESSIPFLDAHCFMATGDLDVDRIGQFLDSLRCRDEVGNFRYSSYPSRQMISLAVAAGIVPMNDGIRTRFTVVRPSCPAWIGGWRKKPGFFSLCDSSWII